MKKLLVGLLVLGSFSSFANCNMVFNSFIAGSTETSEKRVNKIIKKELNKKGYDLFQYNVDADYSFELAERVVETSGSIFQKQTVAVNGSFINRNTQEELVLEIEGQYSVLSILTGMAIKKIVRKALVTIPACE